MKGDLRSSSIFSFKSLLQLLIFLTEAPIFIITMLKL